MHALVLSVTDVNAAMTKSLPPYLMLNVAGSVPTTGWTNPELVPAVYFVEPADGIWDFQFIAERPTGIVNQVVTNISASCSVVLPRWCRGVRIAASTNRVVQPLFSGESEGEKEALEVASFDAENGLESTVAERDPGDAWPWLISRKAIQSAETGLASLLERLDKDKRSNLKVDDLVGMKIRVIPKGGFYTQDFQNDRITFLLDEKGKIDNWLPF